MKRRSRDPEIQTIKARRGHVAYGMGLGIMLLDDVYPGFPGDVRNASAYDFPIQYEIVTGVDIQALCYAADKSACLAPILTAAQKLERMGCRAIAAECGYFALFQREVAGSVDIPVFMSSLLQVPLMQQVVGRGNKVGILCGDRSVLTPVHLAAVGIDLESNIVIAGAEDDYSSPEFESLWVPSRRPAIPCANFAAAEANMIEICKDLRRKHPDMKALLFECTGFQPFARAVQREIDIPLFTWSTLLEYAYSVVVHRDFYGHV
jgi:hypothetical protein